MHEKRFWLRATYMFFAVPTLGLLVWGFLGAALTPGTSFSVAPLDRTGASPTVESSGGIRQAESGRWCEEGLGCSDAN
jgi:hypothetical protein